MKKIYLLLTLIGFILPTVFVTLESIETGNILLYANPLATIEGMFANRISTIFSIDLFMALFVFFIWSYTQSKKHDIKQIWIVWLLTMLFGLGGGFPLFLYLKEKRKEQ
jgi:hypothetical protein